MLKFSDLGILWKVLTLVALLSAFAILGAFYSTSRMRRIDDTYGGLLDGYGRANLAIARANRNLVYVERSLFRMLAETGAERKKQAAEESAASLGYFQKQVKIATRALPDQASAFAEIGQQVDAFMASECAGVLRIGVSEAPNDEAAARRQMREACDPAFNKAMLAVSALTNSLSKASDAASDITLALTNRTISESYVYLLGALALLACLAAALARFGISMPIRAIAEVLERLSHGATDLDVPAAARRDEVGMIARAAVRFRDQTTESQRIRQMAADAAAAEADRAFREQQEKALAAVSLANVVDRLGAALQSLSDGDLASSLGDDFDQVYRKLRDDFNDAISKLGDTISSVVSSAQVIEAGALGMLSAAENLAKRAKLQAVTVEESNVAVRRLSGVIIRTAEASTRTKDIITAAKEEATSSIEVVRETEKAIERIKTSSERIGSIIGAIDEIAFQTNLLALNAGVEAARAGDAGRGFAVVAAEVRALAQRSAEAAKEIKHLVSVSAGEVATGVDLVKATGAAFDRIRTQVSVIDGSIAEIAGQTMDQTQSLKQVNLALAEFDQGSQLNAGMADEATRACRGLAEAATNLNGRVSLFRLPASQEGADERPTREFSSAA